MGSQLLAGCRIFPRGWGQASRPDGFSTNPSSLYRTAAGTVVAMEDRCTAPAGAAFHRQAPAATMSCADIMASNSAPTAFASPRRAKRYRPRNAPGPHLSDRRALQSRMGSGWEHRTLPDPTPRSRPLLDGRSTMGFERGLSPFRGGLPSRHPTISSISRTRPTFTRRRSAHRRRRRHTRACDGGARSPGARSHAKCPISIRHLSSPRVCRARRRSIAGRSRFICRPGIHMTENGRAPGRDRPRSRLFGHGACICSRRRTAHSTHYFWSLNRNYRRDDEALTGKIREAVAHNVRSGQGRPRTTGQSHPRMRQCRRAADHADHRRRARARQTASRCHGRGRACRSACRRTPPFRSSPPTAMAKRRRHPIWHSTVDGFDAHRRVVSTKLTLSEARGKGVSQRRYRPSIKRG